MKNLLVVICSVLLLGSCKDEGMFQDPGNTGKNGSISRFAIRDNFMYAIDVNMLNTYDITDNDNPTPVASGEVGYGLETINIYGNNIFLGAVDGVYVLSLDNPTQPSQLQKIEHHMGCDPVVVQGNYAYSTQRVTNTGCGNVWQESVLAVYDVSQPSQSALVEQIQMEEPYGLAVEGQWLFVCDPGRGGIVVYDVTSPASPDEKTLTPLAEPRDIILMYPYMVVSTQNGFELYNYSDPLQMEYVSTLTL